MLAAMSYEEIRVIFIVYSSVILPLILLIKYRLQVPSWALKTYIFSFIACALGWELWFTYGIWDGLPVDMRRSDQLNNWLPLHMNWLLNSLGDAGAVCMGSIWLSWLVKKKDITIFKEWKWDVFLFLIILCISQNILVELFLYQDQLSIDKEISWAPLSPLGNYINPVLFEYSDRTVRLQGQLPWLIMPIFLYKLVIYLNNRDDKGRV